MTSTIKVNTIQNACGADIIKESGNTITIGASGDTVTLASGASQTGFGRTGTVNWNTTKKTANFDATNGDGFFVDTNSGAITATLPASPSAGNIVAIKDYQGTFSTNACTVARNGSNIRGEASNFILEKNNAGAVFIYVDATEGWQVFVDGSDSDAQAAFICATGGTTTQCGNFRIHTFTGPGTFSVASLADNTALNNVDVTVVAGGGGGGAKTRGGGGGAGGFRETKCSTISGCWTASPLASGTSIPISVTNFPITVGGGGAGAPAPALGQGTSGANSVFSTVTAAGGGGGGGGTPGCASPNRAGLDGGSGGGGGSGSADCRPGGTGNTPPVSPPQGQPGGLGRGGGNQVGSGGGGATAAGTGNPTSSGDTTAVAPGGAGATNTITGSPVARAGGGGGGSGCCTSGTSAGGTGGGGAGGGSPGSAAVAGTANTGGGGGGAGKPVSGVAGAAGGSGVVIIRYKYKSG